MFRILPLGILFLLAVTPLNGTSVSVAVSTSPSPSTRTAREVQSHQQYQPSTSADAYKYSTASVEEMIASLDEPSVHDDADIIIDTLVNGRFKGLTYERLANFTDTIGPRICGSDVLESAVQFMYDRLNGDGLDNVHIEEVSLPYWSRGEESATLIMPRQAKLNMLGLGGSVGTQAWGSDGLTGDVIVVADFDELDRLGTKVTGKIVLFNQQCDWVANPIRCYGTTVIYRSLAAQKVASYGGVAALIRSVAGFSINSPHTGIMGGYGNGPQIPTAALTLEDTDMLQRMFNRGQRIVINLQMSAFLSPTSRVGHNVVAEIKGSERPDEVVIVSGHLDSWDVGQGAMDDGGGAAISWSVLSVLRYLNFRPRRTIRLVMWSCEEFGGIGAGQYFEAHQSELPNMSLVMESDLGVFQPLGLQFTGNNASTRIMNKIGELLEPINATIVTTGGEGTDISPWQNHGVPGASLYNANDRYFWYHHSNGDTMSVLNSDEIDKCAAVWAVHAYTVANLDQLLPRD